MIIKVCGMREAEHIRAVEAVLAESQADKWMGFIFYKPSKRYCAERPDYLPSDCKRVGVFVDEAIEEVVRRVQEFGLHIVQLHGNEDRLYVMQLRQALSQLRQTAGEEAANWGKVVVKAFQIKSASDFAACEPLVGFVDYFLFDTPTPGYGGSGQQFDWSLLNSYRLMTPFLLSGGIGPDSAEALQQFSHPCWEGIDLNSRFESAPGVKDIHLLRKFLVASV
ncbi:MAG: phosphoribosylanthranilate isomerase [Bacteroidales bacterium]|nr:phosphoribosylanthranilate isomerase [Bacteroidales bacterium]